MNIVAKTIKHESQAYPTLGNYFFKKGQLHFEISDTGNEDMNFLIFLHEVVEEYLTRRRGITEEEITKFDIAFENGEIEDSHLYDEPGDHHKSIYRKEHRFAENIERLLAHEMGIDFNDYNKKLTEFLEKPTERREIDPAIGK